MDIYIDRLSIHGNRRIHNNLWMNKSTHTGWISEHLKNVFDFREHQWWIWINGNFPPPNRYKSKSESHFKIALERYYVLLYEQNIWFRIFLASFLSICAKWSTRETEDFRSCTHSFTISIHIELDRKTFKKDIYVCARECVFLYLSADKKTIRLELLRVYFSREWDKFHIAVVCY